MEPLLDLGTIDLRDIRWVIVGGESGNQGRKMNKKWVINIQEQCKQAQIPFFFKQWGNYGEDGVERSKRQNGRLLDGKIFQEKP